jgi:hypothetical protein
LAFDLSQCGRIRLEVFFQNLICIKESAMLRRSVVGIATVAALGILFCATDAFAGWHGVGHGGRYHGGGWRGGGAYWGGALGGAWGGSIYYGAPYYGYPFALRGGPFFPGYVPDDATYCDPNSGTYIGEDGARHLCR